MAAIWVETARERVPPWQQDFFSASAVFDHEQRGVSRYHLDHNSQHWVSGAHKVFYRLATFWLGTWDTSHRPNKRVRYGFRFVATLAICVNSVAQFYFVNEPAVNQVTYGLFIVSSGLLEIVGAWHFIGIWQSDLLPQLAVLLSHSISDSPALCRHYHRNVRLSLIIWSVGTAATALARPWAVLETFTYAGSDQAGGSREFPGEKYGTNYLVYLGSASALLFPMSMIIVVGYIALVMVTSGLNMHFKRCEQYLRTHAQSLTVADLRRAHRHATKIMTEVPKKLEGAIGHTSTLAGADVLIGLFYLMFISNNLFIAFIFMFCAVGLNLPLLLAASVTTAANKLERTILAVMDEATFNSEAMGRHKSGLKQLSRDEALLLSPTTTGLVATIQISPLTWKVFGVGITHGLCMRLVYISATFAVFAYRSTFVRAFTDQEPSLIF